MKYTIPLHIFFHYTRIMEKDLCRGLYTSLFCVIIPTLFPYFLRFWYPYILLHFKCFLLLLHMVRVFNIDAAIRNAFLVHVCSTASLQSRRLLPKTEGFLRNWKAFPRIGSFFQRALHGFVCTEVSEKRWRFACRSSGVRLSLPRLSSGLPHSCLGLLH